MRRIRIGPMLGCTAGISGWSHASRFALPVGPVILWTVLPWGLAYAAAADGCAALDRLVSFAVPVICVAVVAAAVCIVARNEVRALVESVSEVSFGGGSAKFNAAAVDAFATALAEYRARVTSERPAGPEAADLRDSPLFVSNSDFEAAKNLQRLAAHARSSTIKQVIENAADEFAQIKSRPSGPGRNRAINEVMARARLLAYVGRPHIKRLTRSTWPADRFVAVACLQMRPSDDPEMIEWLGNRINAEEEKILQYHAAGALLALSRNADVSTVGHIACAVDEAIARYDGMDKARRMEARRLLEWSRDSLERPLAARAALSPSTASPPR